MHYCPNDQTKIYAVSGVNFFGPNTKCDSSIRYHFIHWFIHKWTFDRIYFCSMWQNLQANFDKIFYDYVCCTSSLNKMDSSIVIYIYIYILVTKATAVA